MDIFEGRPAETAGRLPRELRVYDFLDRLGITYMRADHEPAETMEACQAIDAVLAPAVICKNLFLCNAQRTKFYLLMIRDDKKFKTKDITKQIGSSRLSFAPEEFMEQYLKLTIGSVTRTLMEALPPLRSSLRLCFARAFRLRRSCFTDRRSCFFAARISARVPPSGSAILRIELRLIS